MRSTALLLVLAVVVLPGCGSSGNTMTGEVAKPVVQILGDARNAVQSATSVHHTAFGIIDGRKHTVDITQATPDSFAGHYTTSSGEDTVNFVRLGGSIYIHMKAWSWRRLATQIGLPRGISFAVTVADKWVKFPLLAGRIFTFATAAQTFGLLLGPFANDGETTYRGQRVIVLDDGSGKLYLLPGRRDYPVAYIANNPAGPNFTFDHWNGPLKVSVPKHKINVSKLRG